MINFPSIIPNMPVATDGTPADEQAARPQAGEQTGPQTSFFSQWPAGYGGLGSNGGDCANPCGFPNYGSLYLGHYHTYDWMLEMPTIQHARSMVFDPIISAEPSYEARKGVSEKRKDFIKGQINNLWGEFIGDVLRALDYGWDGFEKVWRITGGQYELECLKALDVNFNGIVTDPKGAFAGIEPFWKSKTFIDYDGQTKSREDDRLGVHKSALFTYDRKFGNLYGRSRLENMRATAWRDWLDAATDIVKLSKKISGKMGIYSTPAGKHKAPDGSMVDWKDNAQAMANALTTDASLVHVYTMGASSPTVPGQQNFEQMLALTKASAVNLELKDFGTNAPAISGLMERMKHDEELMFAGYFQSPRTGMATVGGTKADAQQHTDTATLNAENVAAWIARTFSKSVIDDILVLNFGEAARGSVWMNPAKLTDDNVATDMAIINGVLNNTDGLGTDLLEQVDFDAIADRRGIPHKNPIVLESVAMDDGSGDTLGGGNANDPNNPQPPVKPNAPAKP